MSQTTAQLISNLVQALAFESTSSAPDNGVYLSAANTLSLSTNSIDRITAGTSELVINESGASVDFRVEGDTNANLLFVDASTDRIGVGTSSLPGSGKLQVAGGNASTGIGGAGCISLLDGDANNEFNTLKFDTSAGGPIAAIGAKATTTGAYPNSVGELHFAVQNGASTNTALVIDSSSRVGIGTSSPAALLHLADNNPHIRLEDENDNQDWEIVGSDLFRIRDITNSGADRFVIDGSGNVGIGQTIPQNELSMGTTGSFHTDANSFYLGSNFTGTGQNYIASSKHAQRLFFNNASSNGYFSYANSGTAGTAGNPITWLERMRITSSGQLSTGGETSPDVGGGGLCLNQNADDGIILSFKSSDINHGMTNLDQADTYFSARKVSGAKGGLRLRAYTDAAGGDPAFFVQGYINSDSDTNYVPISLLGGKRNGVTVSNIAANRRIVDIKNSDGTRIASFTGTGLTFGNDDAAANALDDYEEGTHTCTASNGVTLNSSINQISYTKIGRMVTVGGQIQVSNSNSNSVLIVSLPFACKNNAEGDALYTGSLRLFSAGIPSGTVYCICHSSPGQAEVIFRGVRDNNSTIDITATTNGYYMFQLTYPVA
jgi:hypothetical protein